MPIILHYLLCKTRFMQQMISLLTTQFSLIRPLSLWSWQDSIRAVLSNKASVISSYDLHIRSVHFQIAIPSVIALKKFQTPPVLSPSISRRNIFLRDNFRCQYCAKQVMEMSETTSDQCNDSMMTTMIRKLRSKIITIVSTNIFLYFLDPLL